MSEVKNQMEKEEVRKRFLYEDGRLYWRESRGTRTKVGDCAGYKLKSGYRQLTTNKVHYQEHNLVWNYFNGLIPKGVTVDHVVCGKENRSDNRIENLRLATVMEQGRNRRPLQKSASGANGVQWKEKYQAWRVGIGINGEYRHLGMFSLLEDAIQAREDAEKKYWVKGEEYVKIKRLFRNNNSGCTGVSWNTKQAMWKVGIGVKGKEIYLGCFADKEDAIKARKDAEVKYRKG